MDWFDFVTNSILARADGVFLWVTLAVKDQIRGLENGDSLEQLEERLESLPDKVEGIYARMLGQVEKVYRKEASILLQMASQTECRSLLEFVLASHDRLEDMLSSSDPLPEQELIAKSHLARQRIVTTCAGLLEVNDEHEVESHDWVSENGFLESEDAFLQPDNTSLSENESSKSKDVFLKSESAALEPDNESGYSSLVLPPESSKYQGEATGREIYYLEDKVTVDFIHRTAHDFMRDPAQGGSFLRANIPSGFHPQVSYVKVLLAKLRIFGSNYDLNVDDIMNEIRSAEDETGVAQTRLCDLMDDVMSRIDRIRGAWPTGTHWSIRLGDPLWSSMHKELLIPHSRAKSRSSSKDSFHSINSQPDIPDDSSMILLLKPDFLAFAVYYNLHRYVQKVIHDQKKPLGADAVSYLLYCAVQSLGKARRWYGNYPADAQNIIIEFLGKGGNPSLKDSSLTKTIWSTFLLKMQEFFSSYPLIPPNEWEVWRRAYMETIVAFIEKGADLHVICLVASKSMIGVAEDYSLDLEFSALAVIELCLNNQLEHSHLRDLCASKGAPYYARCTQVRITGYEKGRTSKKGLKVSDHESTAILEMYKKVLNDESLEQKFEIELGRCIDELVQDRSEDVTVQILR